MDFSSIHNYYEHLVEHYLLEQVMPDYPDKDDDFFIDIACYALTRLPARYMRHQIDMAFYMQPGERIKIDKQVKKAVTDAIKHVSSNAGQDKLE